LKQSQKNNDGFIASQNRRARKPEKAKRRHPGTSTKDYKIIRLMPKDDSAKSAEKKRIHFQKLARRMEAAAEKQSHFQKFQKESNTEQPRPIKIKRKCHRRQSDREDRQRRKIMNLTLQSDANNQRRKQKSFQFSFKILYSTEKPINPNI
jgi:hypothetical protein